MSNTLFVCFVPVHLTSTCVGAVTSPVSVCVPLSLLLTGLHAPWVSIRNIVKLNQVVIFHQDGTEN